MFVTLDRNLQFQNRTEQLTLGIVVLITRLNDLATYRPKFAKIRDAARRSKPGQVQIVQIQ